MIVILICSCSLEDGEKPEQLIPFSKTLVYGVMEGYPDGENTEPQFWLIMDTASDVQSPWFDIVSEMDVDKDNMYIELLGIAQDINSSSMTQSRTAHGEEYFKISNGDIQSGFTRRPIRWYTRFPLPTA